MTRDQAIQILNLPVKKKYSVEEVQDKMKYLINIYAAHVGNDHHPEPTKKLRDEINLILLNSKLINEHYDYVKKINEAASYLNNEIAEYYPNELRKPPTPPPPPPKINWLKKIFLQIKKGFSVFSKIKKKASGQPNSIKSYFIQKAKRIRTIDLIILSWLLLLTIVIIIVYKRTAP